MIKELKELKDIKEKLEYVLSVLTSANVPGANNSLHHAKEEVVASLDLLDDVECKIKTWENFPDYRLA